MERWKPPPRRTEIIISQCPLVHLDPACFTWAAGSSPSDLSAYADGRRKGLFQGPHLPGSEVL